MAKRKKKAVGAKKVDVPVQVKIWHASVLVVSTIVFIVAIVLMLVRMEGPIEVDWTAPAGMELAPGPVSFRYDAERGVLKHDGRMSTETRDALLELPRTAGSDAPPVLELTRTYRDAVDRLAFRSNAGPTVWWLLVLGGLGSVLGAQARSIWRFVEVVCYTQSYNPKRWWPWFVMRPLLGFVLGFVLIALLRSGLVGIEGGAKEQPDTWWWLGLSFLVGFIALDFVERLEQVAKSAFAVPKHGG